MTTLHTSQALATILKKIESQHSITLDEIVGELGGRVFGLLILILCIPNCLPIPNIAGLSALTGIPIAILGVQMMLGKSRLWFPKKLREKPFSAKRLASAIRRAVPYIKKIEILLHPRWEVMNGDSMHRVMGIVFVTLSVIMSLPVPFLNFLPGFAMALIAIGLIERDGLVIVCGLLVGAGTVAVMFVMADAVLAAIDMVL